jgi:hypothetical protein
MAEHEHTRFDRIGDHNLRKVHGGAPFIRV